MTYFDFDHDRLVAIATAARDLGMELFVLDDGWFGATRRGHDRSLGDWVVDRRKLPDGIDGLARDVHGLGLKFGLWFEPEMVSPDSDLYRAHPDGRSASDGRHRTEGRWQYVLDLGRPEVVDHLAEAVGDVIAERRSLREVGLEPDHHRGRVGACHRTGRARLHTGTSSACTTFWAA